MKMQGPLNSCTSHNVLINRLYTLLHFLNISSIIYYRITTFKSHTHYNKVLLPWLLVFGSEIFLSLYSLLSLSYGWHRVTRTTFPERLPEDEKLPAIDVIVFTSDPVREPPLQVMNTVISAMALDYPPEKVTLYLSDDGGALVTLRSVKEAYGFARWWVPFCRKYKIKTTCPQAFFDSCSYVGASDFEGVDIGARKAIEEKYKEFQDRLREAQETSQHGLDERSTSQDHSTFIEVIGNGTQDDGVNIPSVIYVAREKRPNHPHHFKAGAINALVRVSAVITNAPYILKMDCDMYSNDPSSARQAMCFHLDPTLSKSLSYVQYPQKFYNINKANDIYDGQIRHISEIKFTGIDGLRGPIPCGTGIYIKRECLLGDVHPKELDVAQLKQTYGVSNAFVTSLQQKKSGQISRQGELSSVQLSEAKLVASSSYEQSTKWGKVVGFLYGSALEDYFTGFNLHCRGWRSVYCNPERPAFLGSATINLNDALIQFTRWETGLLDVTLSKFFPLYYGPFVNNLSWLQSMCYAHFGIEPLISLPFWCLSTLPPLCLLLDIPLYTQVTSPWFAVFSLAFLSCLVKHLADVLTTGGSIRTWWNEERNHVMKGVTSFLYGSVDAFMKKLGLKQATFTTTDKVDDEEKVKLYKEGKFDFRTSNKFIVPLAGLVIFNLASFIGGVRRVFTQSQWNDYVAQLSLSFFVILLGYPVIEGMVVTTDNASIPVSVTLKSALFAVGIFSVGSVLLYV